MKDLHTVACGVWIGGTILIVGSWIRIVPKEIGWIGFLVASAGTMLSCATPAMTGNHSNAILVCPRCRQQLRVPMDKGELRVRCPKWSCKWDWKPPTVA